MQVQFDPSAIRAVLKTEDDHWVVAFELASGGSWGRADSTWRSDLLARDELRDIGNDDTYRDEEVIGYVEVSLRRAGWRAARSGKPVTPPTLEVWELTPAIDYGRPKNLFT